jgi:DNA polymerase-3 subunit delta
MRLKADQLESALQKNLKPVYLISGDEPLQLGEAADAVRNAARRAGYAVREVIAIETGNEWPQLSVEAESLSIFADQKLIDLRLPSGKPGQEGSKVLQSYCKNPPDDTLLLITAGKIESSAQKSQWLQAIDSIGAVIQVWPLQGSELQNWLQRRAERKGMHLDNEAARSLVGRIEGNLLAAAQEIEKLFILHGPTRIDKAMIDAAVADSSRFDVFKLMDSLLAGKLNRSIKILHSLQADGTAAPVVLWAINREIRSLYQLKTAQTQGDNLEAVFKKLQVWDIRKPLFQDALRRVDERQIQALLTSSAKADQQIKGQQAGDEWESLFKICADFC